jgi:peptide/nickel transport system permease protein
MLAYIAKRLVLVVPVVFAVALVCFLLVHIAPGDPLISVLPPDASADLAEQMKRAYGFDRPLPVQFVIWLSNALQGNLGTSIATGRSVAEEVGRAVGNTVMLALVAALIGFVFGLLFGFLAGYFRDGWIDRVVTTISITGVSMPHYWLGMVLVIVFSVQLGWLPAVGIWGGTWAWDWEHL